MISIRIGRYVKIFLNDLTNHILNHIQYKFKLKYIKEEFIRLTKTVLYQTHALYQSFFLQLF